MTNRIKRAYVSGARTTGVVLTKTKLLRPAAPGKQHRLRHWAYSLTKVHDAAAMAELDVPWWTYRAIDAVEQWLQQRSRPIRVFEYGSGASTVWLSRRVDEVHSVEHDARFAADHLAAVLGPCQNVTLHVVEPTPSDHPVVTSAKGGYLGLDFSQYVETIDRVGGSFDLIVIDGRARTACLAAALPRLAPDGIVVFDNSRRRRYRRAITASGLSERRLRGLTPTLPYPDRTSILRGG